MVRRCTPPTDEAHVTERRGRVVAQDAKVGTVIALVLALLALYIAVTV